MVGSKFEGLSIILYRKTLSFVKLMGTVLSFNCVVLQPFDSTLLLMLLKSTAPMTHAPVPDSTVVTDQPVIHHPVIDKPIADQPIADMAITDVAITDIADASLGDTGMTTPPPSYVKLAMRNMVRQGRKSFTHFFLTTFALLGVLVGLSYLTR
jgi:hypothetical protein